MTTIARNTALIPLSAADRLFGWRDHAALWLSLGVGLLVMQVGAYLVPAVGTRDAICGDLARFGHRCWLACLDGTSRLRQRSVERRPDACNLRIGIRAAAGRSQHRPVAGLDHLRTGRDARWNGCDPRQGCRSRSDGRGTGIVMTTVLLAFGAILTALMAGSMLRLVRRFVSRFGLPLVSVSLVWLTWQFWEGASRSAASSFLNRPGNGTMRAVPGARSRDRDADLLAAARGRLLPPWSVGGSTLSVPGWAMHLRTSGAMRLA